MTIILVFMMATIAILYWKLYGNQVKGFVRKIKEHNQMKKVMKIIEGRTYSSSGEAEQAMMWFNKMFWGVYGYTHPVLFKNNVDNLWIIRF
jgi:hypothetical protein